MPELKKLGAVAMIVGATLCFALAVYFAWTDKVAAGTLMAGLFIALVLLRSLPDMESFKAFGLAAKMRARINEADELLAKLREMSIAFGRLTYHTLGWGSRMSHPVKLKQELADEVNEVLHRLGIEGGVVKNIQESYVRFAVYDLLGLFQHIAVTIKVRNVVKLSQSLESLDDDLRGNQLDEVRGERSRLDAFRGREVRLAIVDDVEGFCSSWIPAEGTPIEEREALGAFGEKIVRIAGECLKTGRATDEAIALIEKNNTKGRDEVYAEVFAGVRKD